MANPQCENGYTKISNELLEAICLKFNDSNCLRVFMCLIRYTYGYHRKEVEASYKTIAKWAKMPEETIRQIIDILKRAKLIITFPLAENSLRVGINKNYDEWLL